MVLMLRKAASRAPVVSSQMACGTGFEVGRVRDAGLSSWQDQGAVGNNSRGDIVRKAVGCIPPTENTVIMQPHYAVNIATVLSVGGMHCIQLLGARLSSNSSQELQQMHGAGVAGAFVYQYSVEMDWDGDQSITVSYLSSSGS